MVLKGGSRRRKTFTGWLLNLIFVASPEYQVSSTKYQDFFLKKIKGLKS
jgi:hypothetical protein